jgi:CDP-diacylglycerol--glycerol-3-phosphate 3-phosphatidyltransferase
MAASKGVVLAADRYGKWKLVLQVVAIAGVLIQQFPIMRMNLLPIGSALMVAAVLLTVYSGARYILKNYKLLQLSDA